MAPLNGSSETSTRIKGGKVFVADSSSENSTQLEIVAQHTPGAYIAWELNDIVLVTGRRVRSRYVLWVPQPSAQAELTPPVGSASAASRNSSAPRRPAAPDPNIVAAAPASGPARPSGQPSKVSSPTAPPKAASSAPASAIAPAQPPAARQPEGQARPAAGKAARNAPASAIAPAQPPATRQPEGQARPTASKGARNAPAQPPAARQPEGQARPTASKGAKRPTTQPVTAKATKNGLPAPAQPTKAGARVAISAIEARPDSLQPPVSGALEESAKRSRSPKTTNYKGITRIDHPAKRTFGYFVRVTWKKETRSKFFSDKKQGAREAALEAALAWRDAMELELGKPRSERQVIGTARNDTGIVGVRRYRRGSTEVYEATWYTADNKVQRTSYSIAKHGEEGALARALRARERHEEDRRQLPQKHAGREEG